MLPDQATFRRAAARREVDPAQRVLSIVARAMREGRDTVTLPLSDAERDAVMTPIARSMESSGYTFDSESAGPGFVKFTWRA
jgi:hypothetical protein